MRILGIETSCDETAVAIVEDGRTVLSSVVASSIDMHAETGGIIPENAAREQIKYIIPVIERALEIASSHTPRNDKRGGVIASGAWRSIDAIAVTVGPGLIGSLLVGVETAKTLSTFWNKPIIPVNHLVAHLFANYLEKEEDELPEYPALGLVVSGGHTDLVHMNSGPHGVHNFIEWIGGTRDDAAGEAFDKVARLLGLGYPGGPAISAEADKWFEKDRRASLAMTKALKLFPRPMINSDNFDFSFSGLKTAVLNYVNENEIATSPRQSGAPRNDKVGWLAAEVQEAIVDVLVEKSIRAIEKYNPKSFLLSGGVSANKRLVEKFRARFEKEKISTKFYYPSPKYATDNGAVIASAAYYIGQKVDWQYIFANPQLSIGDHI